MSVLDPPPQLTPLQQNQYHDLHVTVFPTFGDEDLRDVNWFDFVVIGHLNPDAVSEEVIKRLVADFFVEYRKYYEDFMNSLDEENEDDFYDDWHEGGNEAFLAYANYFGYTVFKTTKLNWLVE